MADIKDIKLGNTKYNIKIPSSRVKSMADYTKPSSKPSPEAIQQSDTLNAALGKLEYKADTNQTNILYAINTGVKNWFVVPNGNYSSSAGGAESTWEFTDGTCKVIKCTSNDTRAAFNIAEIKLPAGDYVMTGRRLVNSACDVRLLKDGTNITTGDVSRFTLSTESVVEVAAYTYGTASVGTILKPLLCTAEAYAQSTDYQPPALPNSDLTRLESEDRAGLIDVVDGGAKNLVDWRNTTSVLTEVTISDGTYTSNNSDTRTTLRFQVSALNSSGTIISTFNGDGTIPTGNGVLNVPFILPSGTAKIRAGHNGSQRNTRFDIPISGTTLEVGKSYVLQVNVTQYTNSSGIFKWEDLMICTKAAFGVSQKFVPYRPSWDIIQSAITPSTFLITGQTGITISDLDTRKCNGVAWFSMTMKSDSDIAVNTNTSIATVNAATKKKSGAIVVFNVVVSNRPEISARAWISGTTNLQTIQLRTDVLIPANTLVYITGSYLY